MNESLRPPQGSAQGNTSFIILISCIATIGGFLFGFDSGVINGTVDGLKMLLTLTPWAPALAFHPCYSAALSAPSSPAHWPTSTGAAAS